MSEPEENQPPRGPFELVFGPPKPPTPEELIEERRKISNFAKGTLETLRALQRNARDLNTIYQDAPVRHDDLARRTWVIRENVAVMLEMMEGLAEQ